MSSLFRIANLTIRSQKRYFRTTPNLFTFWERDDKGGYRDDRVYPPLTERLRHGLQELKKEVALWRQEVVERFDNDPTLVFNQGEVDVKYRFDSEEALQHWIVTSDSDNKEGYSHCSLSLTNRGKGLFSGEINKRVPKDGRVKRAGYCNMKTVRARKSFKRETYLDWTAYNMLVMRIKGDGRSYMLNIHSRGYWDLHWNDIYHYVLFTRGGPYWQIARIPLSKFFLSSKGRVQDTQGAVPLNKITAFGITAGEPYPGEFALEIDYIGLEFDPTHTEEFAYEMYQQENNIART